MTDSLPNTPKEPRTQRDDHVQALYDAKDHEALQKEFSSVIDAEPNKLHVKGFLEPAHNEEPGMLRRAALGVVHALHLDSVEKYAQKEYGNFIIMRNSGEKIYEAMPMYTRLGMHLLFVSFEPLIDTVASHRFMKFESERQGRIFDGPASASHIPGFVKSMHLNLEELEEPDISKYKTFNEFFYRKVKPSARPIDSPTDETVIVSAADCRLTVFPTVSQAQELWIKGSKFTLPSLLQNDDLANEMENGSIAIFRLAPQDYHRFHSPVSGKITLVHKIAGTYFTVNPCAIKEDLDVYTKNVRMIVVIETSVFPNGDPRNKVVLVLVGALLVGSINLTKNQGDEIRKGEELGYFAFGGSTILGIFPANAITFDQDLIENSTTHRMETIVKVGHHIAAFASQ